MGTVPVVGFFVMQTVFCVDLLSFVVLVCVSARGVKCFVVCAVVMCLVGVVNRPTALGESEKLKH